MACIDLPREARGLSRPVVKRLRGPDEGLNAPTEAFDSLGRRESDGLRRAADLFCRVYTDKLDCGPLRSGTSRRQVKEFCVGLLENPVGHAWTPSLARMGARERASCAMSLFLARKILSSVPDPGQCDRHADLMRQPAPDPPKGYISFIERSINDMFPIGWDKGYRRHVDYASITSSASLECSRSKGGARGWWMEKGQDFFLESCLSRNTVPEGDYRVKYSIVSSSGKARGVTVASSYSHVLGPLHRTLYDFISQWGWVVRGEAKAKKFKFRPTPGRVIVSGDYEAATDNLNLHVTEVILRSILSRCKYVPTWIRDYALRSLHAEISYPGGRVEIQQRGQLMGNFLSFPLLCLQNYLSFRFLVGPSEEVYINGDDIVFQCTRDVYLRWAEGVGALGLTLCKGKTLVNKRFFSLNSSLFEATNQRVRSVPIIRSGSLCLDDSQMPSLSGGAFLRFVRGWNRDSRRLLGGAWLSARRVAIQTTGRSVGCLGIPCDHAQLHTARLADREAFFRGSREHLAIKEKPLPPPITRGTVPPLPGWTRVHQVILPSEKEEFLKDYRRDCRMWAWNSTGTTLRRSIEDWWKEVKDTGYEHAWVNWKKLAWRVQNMCPQLPGLPLRAACFSLPEGVWVPDSAYSSTVVGQRAGIGSVWNR